MTEYDPDTAPGGHDERADDRAHRIAEREAERQVAAIELAKAGIVTTESLSASLAAVSLAALGAAIPQDDGRRHVLIVEEGGMSYIAPHLWADRADCEPLRHAFEAFRAEVGESRASEGTETMRPGRFYCSVDFDGNFAPGSRIPEGASS